MTERDEGKVLVVGAGIVGICAALSLRERGFEVDVLDPHGPSEMTSYGNAGVISPWSCVPQSMPGMWKNVPKWLLDPEGPLAIRWRYAPRLVPWLRAFLAASGPDRLPKIADAMMAVNRPNLDMYHQWLTGTGEEALVRDCSYLHVSRREGGVDPAALAWRLRAERGTPLTVLSGEEAREIEPELSPEVKSAIAITQQGRTVNPGRLGKVLAAKGEAMGIGFLRARVERIIPRPGGGYRLETSGEGGEGGEAGTAGAPYEAGTIVLAAGVWSQKLLADLGIKVLLEAERGYHLVFTEPGITLTHSIADADNKFATSSMEAGVRTAGTAEFAGIDAPPDWRRANILRSHTQQLLPNLNTGKVERWMGRRPSTPDSVPYIGEVPGFPRLYYGFGHGHLGLTGAPMTGRMIAALASAEKLNIDMEPYRLTRFS